MIRLDTNSPMRATGFNLHSSNSTALPPIYCTSVSMSVADHWWVTHDSTEN